jgi:hypothetical protein
MDDFQFISEEAKAKLRRLMELREAKDIASEAEKKAKEEYQDMELEVYEALEGVEGALKVPLGPPWGTVSFSTRTTTYSKILDEDELQEYLEKRALADEIVSTTFAKKRLNELVRQAEEAGDEMPPGLARYKSRGITIKRQK